MNVQISSADQAWHVVPRVAKAGSSFSRRYRGLLASLGVAFLLVSAPALAVAVAPPLGVAQQFGALGNTGIVGSAGAGTAVTGDVGSSPSTPAVTNFADTGGPSSVLPPFIIHPAADAVTLQAHNDAITAFGALSQACNTTYASGQNLGGLSLVPGVYCSLGSFQITGVLTLNGTASDVWIFRTAASTLTANPGSSVLMGSGASACNVYWQVGSSATLNGASFSGNILADASITLSSAGNLTGRALAGTGPAGAVTMSVGGNTIGGCSLNAPLVIGAALPTVSKSFSPTTIAAGAMSTLTFTLSNTSTTANTITSLTDNLPPGMVVAATPAASTSCGGAVNASAGATTVSLGAGNSIPGADLLTDTAGTCTVSVNVTAATAGSLANTVALVTTYGPASASATLTVSALPIAAGVPTLSEWAMIMLAAFLSITGFAAMRRQAR